MEYAGSEKPLGIRLRNQAFWLKWNQLKERKNWKSFRFQKQLYQPINFFTAALLPPPTCKILLLFTLYPNVKKTAMQTN